MKWTDEEYGFLFENYDRIPLEELSKKLGRTVRALEIKINRSGRSLNDIRWETIPCKNCNKKIKVLKSDDRKFCSQSCSASFNNRFKIISGAQRKKVSKSLKNRAREKPDCKICGKKCKTLINVYCSRACVLSDPEYRRKVSEIMKERFKKNPELHPNRLCAGLKESYPEKFFNDYLKDNGLVENIHYKRQFPFNGYFIDFVFSDVNVAVEIDGERWHDSNNPKEKEREELIKEKFELLRFKAKPLINKEFTEEIDKLIFKVKHLSKP